MFTPGLTNTPITKLLLIYTLTASIALSILDLKHLPSIHISPHLWTYGQFWRCVLWQVSGFANSTEALFAGGLVYQGRVVERAWGGRKVVSFLLSTLPYTTLLPPLLLALVLRPLSLNTINYLPSGPTASIFALLAQYYVIIPHTFRYRLSTSSPQSTPTNGTAQTQTQQPDQTEQQPKKSLSLLLSNKSPIYLLASQLALSQFPYMLLPAATGWFIGLAWRGEFLPFVRGDWRVPAWVVGEREMALGRGVGGRGGAGDGEGYEDLRRRLEGEVAIASASASGVGQRQSDGFGNGSGQRQRVR